MFRILLLLSVLTAGLSHLSAQPYQTAAGLRLGYPASVSLKHFVSEAAALEAYVGTRGYYSWLRWYNVSVAYQHHRPLEALNIDGLSWYAGGGASLYFWSIDLGYWGGSAARSSLGVQGYLGLEYGLQAWNLPLSITLDWVPTFYLGQENYGLNRLAAGVGGIGVRYLLR